jgi:group I intron endonuclease
MENIYANPVEITKKDIYIIRNDINSKIYVGQALNAELRFKQHCKKSNLDNSIIGKAIKKYGKKHFWYEIIEHRISNYNEREKYWIDFYRAIEPYGYNILSGGEHPPVLRGNDHPSTVITDESVVFLKQELRNTNISLSDLANEYNISKRQVLRINQGISRTELNEKYPIRDNPNINGKLTEEDVSTIIDLLKYTYFLNGEIARRFNVEVHTISDINSGKSRKRDGVCYPIRNWKSSGVIIFTYEQVTEIIDLLKNTDLSLSEIAKKYNVYIQPIQQINNGSAKKYRRNGTAYPIRRF